MCEKYADWALMWGREGLTNWQFVPTFASILLDPFMCLCANGVWVVVDYCFSISCIMCWGICLWD